ncbi:MAG: biotin transporter BioY [Clostridiales bacterium]|jgi:biotin transport system substrate-specific component|nr:biotin transporter BioY [Clostridiales bacterium]
MEIKSEQIKNIETQNGVSRFKKRVSTRKIVYSALFTALIVIGSYITIDIQPVPFTMQVPFVLLTSLLLGPVWGTVSIFAYIMLGLLGVPVFSSKGTAGIAYIFKPSFGYLIGFLFASVVIGVISNFKNNDEFTSYQKMLFANLIGICIIYAIGMGYMYLIMKLYLKFEITAKKIFIFGFLIFLPKELIFIFLTAFLASKLKPYIKI